LRISCGGAGGAAWPRPSEARRVPLRGTPARAGGTACPTQPSEYVTAIPNQGTKARRRLANLLLLADAMAAGTWVWSLVRGAIVQSRDSSAFERRIHDESATVNGEAAPRAVTNGDLLGRLVIPRLNLRAMVREGAGEDTLEGALGHIPGTALPG